MRVGTIAVALAFLVTSCADRDSEDARLPTPGEPEKQQRDSIGDFLPLPRVTIASARAELDGDVAPEEVEILAEVELSPDGQPLWEDGHRWVVLIRDGSEEHRLVDEFIPQGRLSGWVVEPEGGSPIVVVLKESGTVGIELQAFRFAGQHGYVAAGSYDGRGRLVARLAEGEIAPAQ